MKKLSWGLVVIAFSLSGVAQATEVPADKAELTVDAIPGSKGAVKFPHAKHTKEFKKKDGSAIVCQDCHHTLTEKTPASASAVKACSTCHVKDGEAQKEHNGKKAPVFAKMKSAKKADKKSVIFHKTCVGCHKKVKTTAKIKNLGSCKVCHK